MDMAGNPNKPGNEYGYYRYDDVLWGGWQCTLGHVWRLNDTAKLEAFIQQLLSEGATQQEIDTTLTYYQSIGNWYKK